VSAYKPHRRRDRSDEQAAVATPGPTGYLLQQHVGFRSTPVLRRTALVWAESDSQLEPERASETFQHGNRRGRAPGLEAGDAGLCHACLFRELPLGPAEFLPPTAHRFGPARNEAWPARTPPRPLGGPSWQPAPRPGWRAGALSRSPRSLLLVVLIGRVALALATGHRAQGACRAERAISDSSPTRTARKPESSPRWKYIGRRRRCRERHQGPGHRGAEHPGRLPAGPRLCP